MSQAVAKPIENATHENLPADPMVNMIERVIMNPDLPIDRLERMLELKERHEASEAKALFAADFARASAEFPTIPLNGKGHNGKPYATLEDITKYTRPVLSAHGLALTFSVEVNGEVVVTAKLMHKAGHSESTSMALPRDKSGSKNDVQAVGSTQKYGQRYTAQAILGLSLGQDDEDDGRGAGPSNTPKQRYSWAQTVVQDMPENATPRDKAEAIGEALIASFKRRSTVGQLDNEWDRRDSVIKELEAKHTDIWAEVCEQYDIHRVSLQDAASERQ